jgi:acyl-coenzyme A synthetase/AMP-(fatty) acid ligase
MNYAVDVVEAAPAGDVALIELARDGGRRAWTFGEVASRSAALAGTLAERGVRRGSVVMTVIGNRADWVFALVACFRLGAVALPCSEQLRASDLRRRLEIAGPALVLADGRDADELAGAGAACPVLLVPDERLYAGAPAPAADLGPEEPCLIMFTSGTSGEPKGVVHAQRYLTGQRLQAERWVGAERGDLVWCTTATGWSKSARNVFVGPWLRGATVLLHDARFDPEERLQLIARERVTLLCMSPTEYRVIAKRARLRPLPALRGMVAAGEALNAEAIEAWQQATGLRIRDGFGQTETGALTGVLPGEDPPLGSMGRALPGVRLWIEEGELLVDPSTVPTFFLGYLGEEPAAAGAPWRTGDRVREDEDGFLHYEGRADDVIISAGYRIGPTEVESALNDHPAVAEAAVVSAPDDERGAVVRAIVVLRGEVAPSDALARELQEHVKHATAPYKYPRIVEFAAELPKTTTGKIRRAALRT